MTVDRRIGVEVAGESRVVVLRRIRNEVAGSCARRGLRGGRSESRSRSKGQRVGRDASGEGWVWRTEPKTSPPGPVFLFIFFWAFVCVFVVPSISNTV